MLVNIKNSEKSKFNAEIKIADLNDLKLLSKKWKFNWTELFNKESYFFKLNFRNKIQGLIKLEFENDSYLVLKNIEVAPQNYGSKGKFINIAEILMAFACLKAFEMNIGNYKGFLVFTSKGNLIEYYQKTYSAELIFRERMIISAINGKKLISKYLQIELDE